jgi:meckelin
VDWERPKDRYSSVSVWRKVLIANEFDRLQTSRKTSIELTIFLVTTILYRMRSHDRENVVILFALNVISWTTSIAVQSLWRSFFFERYVSEPKAQRFIDLSTLANISMIVLDTPYHGFMLHCQSPYEFSDCSMEDICDNMRNEGRGIVASRGLESSKGGPKDCQAYELFLSVDFKTNFYDVSKECSDHTFLHNSIPILMFHLCNCLSSMRTRTQSVQPKECKNISVPLLNRHLHLN